MDDISGERWTGEEDRNVFRSFFMKCSPAGQSMAGQSILPFRSGAAWDDLDILEFERFRRTIRESHGMGEQTLISLSDRELARALGAVDGPMDHPEIRLLALLLFGKEERLGRFLPSHEVA
ncbi:transcriptional regulator, partial [mine drainage metagenome]